MISDVIDFIGRQVQDQLALATDELLIDSFHKTIEVTNSSRTHLCLVNIEEDSSHMDITPAVGELGESANSNPQSRLNLYILFAFDSLKYSSSLENLSKLIDMFKRKPVYRSATRSDSGEITLPVAVELLQFEMVNMDLEDLCQLWSILDRAYLPSVLYKVRVSTF